MYLCYKLLTTTVGKAGLLDDAKSLAALTLANILL